MRSHRVLNLSALFALFAAGLRAQPRPPARCDQLEAAVRADSSNLDAAASLGRCSVRDYEMIAVGGDSNRLVFRSSWSTALRALRHAVAVDPGYSRAYRPLFRILFAETRDGCSFVTGECRYVSPVVRAGDSVQTVPRLVRLNATPDPYHEVVQESQATRRENLTEARDLAQRWVAVAPNDRQPHEYLGQALQYLGDAAAAATQLELAAALGTPESRRALFWDRIEALIKADRGADARLVLDEAADDPGRDTTQLRKYTLATLNALVGRHRPPPVDTVRLRQQWARLDSTIRARPPAPPPPPSFSALLAAGDTNAARATLAREDSEMAPLQRTTKIVLHSAVFRLQSAEQHLALADTAGAEAQLRVIEQPFNDRRWRYAIGVAYGAELWSGRAWLLAGDVAAARRRREDAMRMYRRVIGLWGGGDPDTKPVVDRARARLDFLSRR